MRRVFLCLLAGFLLFVPGGLAQGGGLDAAFSAIEGLRLAGCGQDVAFFESGAWMSAVVVQSGPIAPMMEGTQVDGLIFEMETGERVGWDDLFIDGDAAAERMEDIAEASIYRNAYGEYDGIRPMPRDSFALLGQQLTVYYPAERLATFSGRSGAFSFYAYELDGLPADGVPLAAGNVDDAAAALLDAYLGGFLPGFLMDWPVGRPMTEARDALGLEDVPNWSLDYALYRFEAPQMRGVTLLSSSDDVNTAVIEGVMAERIDFSGLCTGVTPRAACVAALGEPELVEEISGADAYSRLPDGETLVYQGFGREVRLHFVSDILHSITIS